MLLRAIAGVSENPPLALVRCLCLLALQGDDVVLTPGFVLSQPFGMGFPPLPNGDQKHLALYC